MNEIHAIFIYFLILLLIAVASYSKEMDASDFFVGRRSMNYWLTALSAHASDMSSWLFLAFPATIYMDGLFKAWIAIGLLLFMYLNWKFIAPRLRAVTESYNSLTFFSYLQKRFQDRYLSLYCTLICFFFYVVYIASGFIGMGLLIEKIYGVTYETSLFSTVAIVLVCVVFGGYRTLAWIDLFQGCFLLVVLVSVPIFILNQLGGWSVLQPSMGHANLFREFFPDTSVSTVFQICVMVFGWGLGYFGQPAILTKFMGINRVDEIKKSKYIGMIWMFLSLSAASLVGLVATAFFQGEMDNPEMLFIYMVRMSFHPFISGMILCAVFAATINVISSQLLVIGSSFYEDFYKILFKKNGKNKSPLFVTKFAICIACLIGGGIAYLKISSIYNLVLYAWSGLGSAFGPILLFSLYTKRVDKKIAWASVLTGSLSSAVWPWIETNLQTGLDSMLVGFFLSCLVITPLVLLKRDQSIPALTTHS